MEVDSAVRDMEKRLPSRFVVEVEQRKVLRAESEIYLASYMVVGDTAIGIDTQLRLTVFELLLIDLDMVFSFCNGSHSGHRGGIPQGYIAECYILNPREILKKPIRFWYGLKKVINLTERMKDNRYRGLY